MADGAEERQRKGLRDGLIAVALAGVLGAGMYVYLRKSIPTREQLLAQPSARPSAGSADVVARLEEAGAVAERMVEAAGAGRFDEAHALMAAPYRQSVDAAGFAEAWRKARPLAGARTYVVRTKRQEGAALSVHGVVGNVDAMARLVIEGGQPRVLTFVVAGVPVLDGVTGR